MPLTLDLPQLKKVEIIRVDIGYCGVVTSYVDPDGFDVTDDAVNEKIVNNRCKGICAEIFLVKSV